MGRGGAVQPQLSSPIVAFVAQFPTPRANNEALGILIRIVLHSVRPTSVRAPVSPKTCGKHSRDVIVPFSLIYFRFPRPIFLPDLSSLSTNRTSFAAPNQSKKTWPTSCTSIKRSYSVYWRTASWRGAILKARSEINFQKCSS